MRRVVVLVALCLLLPLAGSVSAQQWKLVGIVTSDACRGETVVIVDMIIPIQEGRLILIESRNRTVQETYEVRHVYDHNVLLETLLKTEVVSGARIFQ